MLSKNLETIRRKKGFSRKTLSIKSGISASTIGLIEWGMSENPQIATLKKLADALGVTVSDLIDD